MTAAQQQVKELLGKTFPVIQSLSIFRKSIKDLGQPDDEFFKSAHECLGFDDEEKTRKIIKAVDVYDKHFS